MRRIDKDFWLQVPALVATVYSQFWLLSALGLGNSFWPFSVPHLILFIISFYTFEKFYTSLARLLLSWIARNRASRTGNA